MNTAATSEDSVIIITIVPNCCIAGMSTRYTDARPAIVVHAASINERPVFSIAIFVASVFCFPFASSSLTLYVIWIP